MQEQSNKRKENPDEMQHERIATVAYELWQARGCPEGSPEQDWFRAQEKLKNITKIDAPRAA
ncbi:MAG TPA: DUF2934 domain-containing protein [Bryobacteraceae bacterium]|jgi:hypothetical protein